MGVELDASSHRAIDIYDNAMFVIAISDFLQLLDPASLKIARWTQIRDQTKQNIRKYLWDKSRGKFIPHVYLDESPFPKDFDESAIYYHGGTAVAIEAGILSHEEMPRFLKTRARMFVPRVPPRSDSLFILLIRRVSSRIGRWGRTRIRMAAIGAGSVHV